MTYYYGMRMRGCAPLCQPKDFTERLDDTSGRYHDILTYTRRLTDSELYDYELDYLGTAWYNSTINAHVIKEENTMPDTEKKKRKPLTPEQREAQYKRSAEWNKKNTILMTFKLVKTTEADIIEHLATIENKTGYIKSLIRADIAAHADDDTPDDISFTGTFENGVHTLRRKD